MANRRKKVEAVADFIFLGCKITADCDYSHEIKRGLPLGPDTPGSPEGNTEGPGTASSEPLLPS